MIDNKSNIDILHQADLDIVKEVVALCDKHELKYYMLGGSMLGAIRHKGFIPWDDDIDLGMPRKDYEHFLEIAPAELSSNLKIVNYKTDSSYHYYITRVLDIDSKVMESRFESEGKYTNLSIDIFPLDGTPNNWLLRKWYCFWLMAHRAMASLHYKDVIVTKNRNWKEALILWVMMKLPTEKMFNHHKQLDKCDKMLKKYPMEKSNFTGNMMGAYKTRELIPTSWYGESSFYDFEGLKLRGIKEYDLYLKQLYGDYMQLPPEDKRKIHFELIEIHGHKLK